MIGNDVVKKDGFYISVAFKSTLGDGLEEIDETALVFTEDGRQRFWILKHDVRGIYDQAHTLEEAKAIFLREVAKGNEAFWSDYDPASDNLPTV